MYDGGLGSVVRGLEIWKINDVAAHRRRGNEAAVCEALKLAAVERGTLSLLPPPVQTGHAGAVKDPVNVRGHDP